MNTPSAFASCRKGYTLVELMVALVIVSIIVGGVYETYISLHKTWLQEDIKAEMQQSTRVAFDTMVREMLMMGYGSDSKINESTQSKLKFQTYMEDHKLYYITYELDGTKLKRSKQEVGSVTTVTDYIVENVKKLSFEYYDAKSTLLDYGALGSQTTRDEVRRVTVTLQVQSPKPMPNTNPPKYMDMTLKADLFPKNLWEGEVSLDTDPPPPVGGLKIRDTLRYGRLKATWNKSTAPDAAGYLVKYGTTDGFYTYYQDVPISIAGDPPHVELTGVPISYYTDAVNANSMYVVVQVYDRSHNYSTASTPSIHNDPFPNYTGFSQSTDDTTNNLPKPPMPQSFVAANYTSVAQVRLQWTPQSGNPNVVGYRVYRKESPFVDTDFPIEGDIRQINPSIVMLAKDTETGDGWTYARLNASDSSYMDADPALVGCKTYYYAICAVTYDRTRIWGGPSHKNDEDGRYTAAQYNTCSNYPKEKVKPSNPTISTGSKPGWRRVFIQHSPPLTNDDGTAIHDYAYTKLFYTSSIGSPDPNAPPPPDPPMPTLDSPVLPKDIEGKGPGIVTTDRTIIFNSLTDPNYPDMASPQLPVNSKFRILAVAYDNCGNASSTTSALALTLATLCGDDPPNYPRWPDCAQSPSSVWATLSTTELDTSNWNTYPASTTLTLNWTDVQKTGNPPPVDVNGQSLSCPGNMIDFQGFNIRKSTYSSFPVISGYADYNANNGDILAKWESSTTMGGLAEGNTYYFCVQTSDCFFWSHSGASSNVSPVAVNPSGGFKPGRIILGLPPNNVAGTDGEFHNKVVFYIQNTSAGTLNIETMKFKWLNEAAHLASVTIGQAPNTTTTSVASGPNTLTTITGAFPINDLATGFNSPSAPIPVVLEFKNADNTVNQFTDMRGDIITMEFQFTNNSMGISNFTTGDVNIDTKALKVGVTSGPSINYVKQDKPNNPTDAFKIEGVSALSALPAGFPQVPGLQQVTVIANVTKPSVETISSVSLKYALTNVDTVINPSASVFSTLNTTASGSDYTATIPAQENKGIWYFVEASTVQGNHDRSPKGLDDYYYYKQLPFNPCNETPSPPTGLRAVGSGLGSLVWTAPTKYVSGSDIPASDSLVYDVYRRTVNPPGNTYTTPLSAGTGISTTTFIDPTNMGTTSYAYAVKARNSCTSQVRQSDFSNEIIQCAGSGCVVNLDAGTVYLNTNWTTGHETCASVPVALRVVKCGASNGVPYETLNMTTTSADNVENSTILLHEIKDTGVFSFFGTGDSSDNIQINALFSIYGNSNMDGIQGATKKSALSDTITFSVPGCSSATLTVNTDKCSNTPAGPSINYINRNGSGLDIQWPVVLLNTDGSTADDIAGYEVWYALDTETNLNNYALAQGLTFTTSGGYVYATGNSVLSANPTYKFYVKAVDSCSPTPNKSTPSASDVIQVIKNGTYGTRH